MTPYKNVHLSDVQDAWQADLNEHENELQDLLAMYEKEESYFLQQEEAHLEMLTRYMAPFFKARKERKSFSEKINRLRKKLNSKNDSVVKIGEKVRCILEDDACS